MEQKCKNCGIGFLELLRPEQNNKPEDFFGYRFVCSCCFKSSEPESLQDVISLIVPTQIKFDKRMKNLTGLRFGRLFVISLNPQRPEKGPKELLWNCICECGSVVTIRKGCLLRGKTRSCGCLGREVYSLNCKLKTVEAKPDSLASKRIYKGLTIDEAALCLGISINYLKHIERGFEEGLRVKSTLEFKNIYS